ncbi:MAG: iron-sulfur cluster assembly scaffold protein [Candidatus Aminicenantes bacterium]|nr:iron-sulfur cluster assembly scaffold protein [Candidatus Aminicenantes bacterium]
MTPDETDFESQSGPVLFYNDIVMDHVRNPRNVGEMSEEEANGFSLIGDSSCGDVLKLWIKVESEQIVDIKFKTFGCPGAISTSSMLTVMAKGRSIEDAKKLTDDDVVMALEGIPERKKHCSLLGVTALHHAIQDYEQKNKRPKTLPIDHL